MAKKNSILFKAAYKWLEQIEPEVLFNQVVAAIDEWLEARGIDIIESINDKNEVS